MTKQITFDQIELVTYGAYDTFPGKLTPIAAAIRGESEMGGGGLGKVLGLVVAIAVPFIAPYVATAVFGASVMSGAITGVLASAATGAVLGGAGAALTGGDWRKGALFGGIGGGLTQGMGGFGSSNNPLFGQASTTNAGFFGPAGTVTPAGQGQTGMLSGITTPTAPPAGGAVTTAPTQTLTPTTGGAGTTLTSAPPPAGGAAATTDAATALSSSSAPTPVSQYSLSAGPSSGVGLRPPGTNVATNLGGSTAPTTFTGELASRFTNPARLADMAIMSTPQIVGQLYAMQAGGEQQKRIDQYQKELKSLEGKDQAAYQTKLKEAQEYIANAKNINPNYWAQMAGNQANITGSRRLAETYRDSGAGLRDLSGERRRDIVGLSQNVGTSYNQGYQSGVGLRDQAMRTGYGMLPNAPRTALEGQRQVASMYADLDNSRAAAAQGMSQTASYFTYPFLSNYRDRV